jgi:hypothetical protein
VVDDSSFVLREADEAVNRTTNSVFRMIVFGKEIGLPEGVGEFRLF